MKRSGSKDQSEGLPVAHSVWVVADDDNHHNNNEPEDAVESGLRAELIPDAEPIAAPASSFGKQQPPSNYNDTNDKNKKNEDAGDGLWSSGGYSAPTTGQGYQQSYWGRFDDAQAQVLPPTAPDGDGSIPVATARPDDRAIRLAFIRKVYTILSAQLAVTFSMCALITLNSTVRGFALGPGLGLYYVNMVAMLVLICMLHAYKRTYPHNYVLLSAFTLTTSYMVGTITALYANAGAGDLVVEAIFITFSVFIVLTIFTLQSKWDFSFMGAGLGVCLWIMLLFGIFSMIFGIQTGFVYALMGSILFSLYIIYDTYMIAERLDPEDYIVAAIELYLDLINLFLYILRMLAESNRR